MTPAPNELIELKRVLYGPGGLYPDIRHREVREKIGRIYRRKSRFSGFTQEFVRTCDYERAHALNLLLADTCN